jgi:hypothetical protein
MRKFDFIFYQCGRLKKNPKIITIWVNVCTVLQKKWWVLGGGGCCRDVNVTVNVSQGSNTSVKF